MILTTTYTLERDDESFMLEITYEADREGSFLEITEVEHLGQPFPTTIDEDDRLLTYIGETFGEDLVARDADEADYRYDLMQERKYFDD